MRVVSCFFEVYEAFQDTVYGRGCGMDDDETLLLFYQVINSEVIENTRTRVGNDGSMDGAMERCCPVPVLYDH